MVKRIVAFFLLATLCLTMQPIDASAGSDWASWVINEENNGGNPYLRYNAPFQDASFDEIIYCVANVLSEYISPTGIQNEWKHRQVVFNYSTDETFASTLNAQANTVLGPNNNRIVDTILYINSRVFNHSLINNSALLYLSANTLPNNGEIYVYFSVNMRSGDEVRQKLVEIVSEAKAYSSTDYGRLEYINKYLIDSIRYSDSNPNGEWGQSTYEAIMLGTAVCGGYASAVQDICFLLGIPSIVLKGRNHAWNYVYVDDQWKMLDVTWNDSNANDKAYFLVDFINDDTHNIEVYDDIERLEIAKDFVLKLHKIIEPVIVGCRPVSLSDAPSTWAVEHINTAISIGLVPLALQSKYTQTITRAEYCALAVALYEKYTDTQITGRRTFDDTNDVNVEKMAAIGVVLGIGNNMFDPSATLNREQATVMLCRLADAIGKPFPKQASTFNDNADISSWAIENVGQAQAVGIMNGIGNNTFAPKDPYTIEQSIVAMGRLWNIIT